MSGPPVDDLDLSVRTRRTLIAAGIETTEQMVEFFAENDKNEVLAKIRGFGAKSYHEVKMLIDSWRQPRPSSPPSYRSMLEPSVLASAETGETLVLLSIAVSLRRMADRICGGSGDEEN